MYILALERDLASQNVPVFKFLPAQIKQSLGTESTRSENFATRLAQVTNTTGNYIFTGVIVGTIQVLPLLLSVAITMLLSDDQQQHIITWPLHLATHCLASVAKLHKEKTNYLS